jgi:hypothetical protein
MLMPKAGQQCATYFLRRRGAPPDYSAISKDQEALSSIVECWRVSSRPEKIVELSKIPHREDCWPKWLVQSRPQFAFL